MLNKETKLRAFVKSEVFTKCDKMVEYLYKDDNNLNDLQGLYGDYDPWEHWVVSKKLAGLLKRQGDLVANIHGLYIWGRATNASDIHLDYVIEQAYIFQSEKF